MTQEEAFCDWLVVMEYPFGMVCPTPPVNLRSLAEAWHRAGPIECTIEETEQFIRDEINEWEANIPNPSSGE